PLQAPADEPANLGGACFSAQVERCQHRRGASKPISHRPVFIANIGADAITPLRISAQRSGNFARVAAFIGVPSRASGYVDCQAAKVVIFRCYLLKREPTKCSQQSFSFGVAKTIQFLGTEREIKAAVRPSEKINSIAGEYLKILQPAIRGAQLLQLHGLARRKRNSMVEQCRPDAERWFVALAGNFRLGSAGPVPVLYGSFKIAL